MSAASVVLDRLDGVRQTAPDRWIARCPSHEDKSPSLSIRETADGRVLLHDFAGCRTADIMSALCLSMADLFEKPLAQFLPPIKARIPARDVIELVGHEIDLAGILLAEIIDGRGCTELAWQRLAKAAQRINSVRNYVNGR